MSVKLEQGRVGLLPSPESMHSHAFTILADRRYEPKYPDFFSEVGSRTWEKGDERTYQLDGPNPRTQFGVSLGVRVIVGGHIPKRGAHDEDDTDRLRRV